MALDARFAGRTTSVASCFTSDRQREITSGWPDGVIAVVAIMQQPSRSSIFARADFARAALRQLGITVPRDLYVFGAPERESVAEVGERSRLRGVLESLEQRLLEPQPEPQPEP